MVSTNYDPVSWTSGPITTNALQQMANNDQWIYENMPRMVYYSPSINRSSGLKIASGRTTFGSSHLMYKDVTVYFGNFFTAGCKPVVVATVHSFGGQRQLATVRGLGNAHAIDNRGFISQISSQENYPHAVNRIAGGILNWIAVGY
jgi:hypothetical protein